jgi:hypothetical protein
MSFSSYFTSLLDLLDIPRINFGQFMNRFFGYTESQCVFYPVNPVITYFFEPGQNVIRLDPFLHISTQAGTDCFLGFDKLSAMASRKFRPMAITSPTDFICRAKRRISTIKFLKIPSRHFHDDIVQEPARKNADVVLVI